MSQKTARANVEPIRQRTQYTCMSTSMTMALRSLGYDTDEDQVNEVMGAQPMRGAAWESALACANHYGCISTLRVPSTVRQLKAWTDAGIPVMIAWNPEGRDWSHASLVYNVSERPETINSTMMIKGEGPGLYVWVADPNLPNPEKLTRIVHEDEFYGAWYEKWPNYLVRRPACAIQREITPDGRQVLASSGRGWYLDHPEADSNLVSQLQQLADNEGAEATNAIDALTMLAWDQGYTGGKLAPWFKTLAKQLRTDIQAEYRDGLRAGKADGARSAAKRLASRSLVAEATGRVATRFLLACGGDCSCGGQGQCACGGHCDGGCEARVAPPSSNPY